MWTDLPAGAINLCLGWPPHAVAPPGSCTGIVVSTGTLTTVTGVYTPGPCRFLAMVAHAQTVLNMTGRADGPGTGIR
jgi:hypothetical protein